MRVNIKCGLILFFCILLAAGYCFAADLDISISDILFPRKISLKERNTVYIYLANNSGADVENCTLTVEADDGSKISQTFTLSKSGQRVELKWVPQRQGKMQFKVTLTPAKGIKEKNKENNQVTETVEVLPK
jgi:hypothetical protein